VAQKPEAGRCSGVGERGEEKGVEGRREKRRGEEIEK
jgi:hypothetical protein